MASFNLLAKPVLTYIQSEYWVSNKKYYCKYCEIYIADDAPSRTQHETGLRHTGNKERFIRNLYKTGEKKKRDDEEEKREMARIELAAQAAFASDVQSGRAKASTSSVPAASAKPAASKPKPSGGLYANYTTAKDLGIAQEEEILAEQAFQLQQSQGVVGQWEVVDAPSSTAGVAIESASIPQKRPLQQDDDDPEGDGYRVQRRKLNEGLGQVYDPGEIKIVPKTSERDLPPPSDASEQQDGEGKSAAPKWSTKRWKAAGAEDEQDREAAREIEAVEPSTSTLKEEVTEHPILKDEEALKPIIDSAPLEDPPAEVAPAKSMFKKRKAPTQATGTKAGIRKQL